MFSELIVAFRKNIHSGYYTYNSDNKAKLTHTDNRNHT